MTFIIENRLESQNHMNIIYYLETNVGLHTICSGTIYGRRDSYVLNTFNNIAAWLLLYIVSRAWDSFLSVELISYLSN